MRKLTSGASLPCDSPWSTACFRTSVRTQFSLELSWVFVEGRSRAVRYVIANPMGPNPPAKDRVEEERGLVAFNARRRHQESVLGHEDADGRRWGSFARPESTELTARATPASSS